MTTDLVSLADAMKYLSVPQDTTELPTLISAASARIDDLVGNVVQRGVVEKFDGGGPAITLRKPPAVTINSVTEYWFNQPNVLSAETNTSKPGLSYLFDPYTNTVFRRMSGWDWSFWPGRQNVVVDYLSGRFVDTASVEPRFKQACLIVVAHIWKSEMGTTTATFGQYQDDLVVVGSGYAIPRRALELLGYERRVRIGLA